MREIELRNKLITVAKSFLGYDEASGGDDIIIKQYNKIKPKGGYNMSMNDHWCAAFGSVVGYMAGLSEIIPIECSCQRMIDLFKKMGRWEEDGTIVPKIGDYIFYNWNDKTQPNDGWADHVGIVVGVTGKNVKIIEGNYNDQVEFRTITIGWGYIRGYGRPDYASLVTKDQIVEDNYSLGTIVEFIGTKHYGSSYPSAKSSGCTPGVAEVTAVRLGNAHPYHLVGVKPCTAYGWVNEEDIQGVAVLKNDDEIEVGDKVRVIKAKAFTGKTFKVYHEQYDVLEVKGDRIVIGIKKTVTCAIHRNNVRKV